MTVETSSVGTVGNDGITAVYSGATDDSMVALQPTEDGLRAAITIDSVDAPEAYNFEVGGDVASLRLNSDGSVAALDLDGNLIAEAASPWAVDANGQPVPTHYEVNGTTLTQVVEHHSGSWTYGIVADPTFHWWGVRWTLSHTRTQKLILAMSGASAASGVVALLCGGTIAGAIPCGIGYGVVAGVIGFGTAMLNYCDRNAKGITLDYHWFGSYWSCSTR
ncbi:hypothetical protein E8D37_15735 [Nocardioides sp. GY 10127]|nr:hypothetical protein E8D37_15735 [Nocardioides sp. GY 10127]